MSGSSRWPSKPAEISNHVGAKRSTTGATTSSNAFTYTSPVAPGGRGMFIVVPDPAPMPVSVTRPVPGYSGHWWKLTNSTRGSSMNAAWVPLPWWAS